MEDVQKFTGSAPESYGAMTVDTRPPHDEPERVSPQSYAGYYCDWTQQDEHALLFHGFTGTGGFKGDIPINYDNPQQPNQDKNKYSYIMPMFTEMQYRNRVKQTVYYNYLARYVNSIVSPVFAQNVISTQTMFRGDIQENDIVDEFVKDCTGTRVSYNTFLETALKHYENNDAVYLSMTKRDEEAVPSLSMFRTIDIVNAECDPVTGDVVSITVYRGKEHDDEKEILYAVAWKFYMEGSTCKIDILKGEWCGELGNWEDIEWLLYDTRDTGVPKMVVEPFQKNITSIGEVIPENPSMMRVMNPCMAIFQEESRISWLFALHCLPTPVIWGDINGALLGAGNMIAQTTTTPETGYLPKPDYMATPSGHLSEAMAKLQHSIERLREIAKENGVDTKTGSQAQSGDSKRFDFQATEQKLRGTVNSAKEIDEWVFSMFNIYNLRGDEYTYRRNYPVEFYPEEQASLDEYGYWAEQAKNSGLGETFKIIASAGIRKLLGRSMTKEDSDIIDAEMETAKIDTSGIE